MFNTVYFCLPMRLTLICYIVEEALLCYFIKRVIIKSLQCHLKLKNENGTPKPCKLLKGAAHGKMSLFHYISLCLSLHLSLSLSTCLSLAPSLSPSLVFTIIRS